MTNATGPYSARIVHIGLPSQCIRGDQHAGLQEVNDEHRFIVGEAHGQEFVVQMISVCSKGRAPFFYPLNHDSKRIEGRQPHQKQGQCRIVGSSIGIGEDDGGNRHEKSEELAACVAHEDSCGIGVEA